MSGAGFASNIVPLRADDDEPFYYQPRSMEQQMRDELAELRTEVRELREALVPLPSLILTGKQVLDEFKRLRQGTGDI